MTGQVELHNMAKAAMRSLSRTGTCVARLKRWRGDVTGVEAQRFEELGDSFRDATAKVRALVEATRPGPEPVDPEQMREDAREAVWQ